MAAPKLEQLARQHGGKVKAIFINVVQGGDEEAAFAAKHGISAAKRFVCLEAPPEFGVVSIPHVTVVHSSGMVVRNGPPGSEGFPDAIEPLLQNMVMEGEPAGAVTEAPGASAVCCKDGPRSSACVLL